MASSLCSTMAQAMSAAASFLGLQPVLRTSPGWICVAFPTRGSTPPFSVFTPFPRLFCGVRAFAFFFVFTQLMASDARLHGLLIGLGKEISAGKEAHLLAFEWFEVFAGADEFV